MKKEKIILVIITIIIIFVIGLSIIFIKNNTGKEPNQNNVNDNKETEEIEVNDNNLLSELNKKINIIFKGYNESNLKEKNIRISSFELYGSIFSNNMSDKEKLQHLLSSIYKQEMVEKNIDLKNIELDIPIEQFDIPFISGEISANKVQQQAKLIYGNELINQSTSFSKCPTFIYDKKNEKYYVQEGCGGNNPDFVEMYINKYATKNNEVYVYVNVAELSTNINDSNAIAYIFNNYVGAIESTNQNNYNSIQIYKKISSFDEIGDTIINESNYKQFKEYKIVFKKDVNNNYYFDKIEGA